MLPEETIIKNLATFLERRNIYNRVVEIINAHRGVDPNTVEPMDPYNLLRSYMKHRKKTPYEFINYLCSWTSQPEGGDFWRDLHREWQEICDDEIVLEPVQKLYKSIW